MSLSQNLPVYPPWHAQPMYTNLLSVLTLSPSSGCTHWPPWLQAHMLIVGFHVALAPLSSVATNDMLNYNKRKRSWWFVFTLFSHDISGTKWRKTGRIHRSRFEFWHAWSNETVNRYCTIVHGRVKRHRLTFDSPLHGLDGKVSNSSSVIFSALYILK